MNSMYENNSLSGTTAVIKVTPEELKKKADVVKNKVKTMKGLFSDIAQYVEKSKSYWIGEAGNTHRSVYKACEPDVTEIFARLSEHVVDLETMAGVYQSTENEIKEISMDLPSDVIK